LEGLGALFNSFGIALLSLLNREPEQPAHRGVCQQHYSLTYVHNPALL